MSFRRLIPFFGITIISLSLLASTITFATGNTLYLNPTTSSPLSIGGSLTVNVRGYVSDSASSGSVSGSLTYPQNVLNVANISTSSSGFGSPTITQGNGVINFSGTQSPKPVGQIQIFSVTFTAVGGGSAPVAFSSGSNLDQSQTNLVNGNYTVNTPAPPPSPTPTPTPAPAPQPAPAPSSAPASSDTSQSNTDTTAPDGSGLIQNVSVATLYTSATITWSVSAPSATSTLLYGTSSDQVSQPAQVTKVASGSYSASMPNLLPGNRYYIVINATNNGVNGTYSRTIIAQGYPVKLLITQAKSPASAAKITIGQQTYAATSDGTISLALAADTYNGTITATDGTTQQATFIVEKKTIPNDGSAPSLQQFSFDLPAGQSTQGGSSFSIFGFIGILMAGFLLVAIGFFFFVTIRRRQLENNSGVYNPSSESQLSVVINDGYSWHEDKKPVAPSPTDSASQSSFTPMHNSVFIDDAEPVDMFDQAKKLPLPDGAPTEDSPNHSSHDWPRNSSQPHSTTP